MDEGRRFFTSTGKAACSSWSDVPSELWHSTPVKKREDDAACGVGQASGISNLKMDGPAFQRGGGPSTVPADSCFSHSLQEAEFPVKDLSGSTIQRQRRELQLLMAELKDREMELNAMAASHHKQHQAWVQDRQRVLTLEQRCARLDEELQKRTEVIRVLTRQVWVVESREKEVQKELSGAKQQLCELQEKQRHISDKCQDYEEKNQSLSSSLVALSTQVGSLQVKEEELSSMLKLKDKDVTEASSHIRELSGRLRDLETALKESRSQESKLLRDLEDGKRRHKDSKHEVTRLKEELQQQVTQSSTQREEIIRLKQELQLLHTDLVLTGQGDSWKDELLELSRSKQERIMSELRCLQQMCETQRNDLQLLRLNQESARESVREKTSHGSLSSQDVLTCSCTDLQSPSSLRGKNLKPVGDSLPAADPPDSASRELGARPAHFTHGEEHLSSCSLQQMLDESRLFTAASESSSSRLHSCLQHFGASHPLYLHEFQTHHYPDLSTLKTSETPPRVCPRHRSSLPASQPPGTPDLHEERIFSQ